MLHLSYDRLGAGEPLVLLHGIGLSRASWAPVLPQLARSFDVLAVDLPGFGDSPALPHTEPTPANLAAAVAGQLDHLGIGRAHLAGNSLGGWVALELAHLRPPASVTLLSPAGFWRDRTPLYCRLSLRGSHWLARRAPHALGRLTRTRAGRYALFRQSHGRPGRLTPESARAAIAAMGSGPGFAATLRATDKLRYTAASPITASVSVAFGSRDGLLLAWQSRHLDQLPAHAVRAGLPGCGHVPMADDPVAVTDLIHATARTVVTRGVPTAASPLQ